MVRARSATMLYPREAGLTLRVHLFWATEAEQSSRVFSCILNAGCTLSTERQGAFNLGLERPISKVASAPTYGTGQAMTVPRLGLRGCSFLMVARSPGLTNRTAGRRTPTALPSLLPLLLKVNGFAAGSVCDSPGSECLQTAEADI